MGLVKYHLFVEFLAFLAIFRYYNKPNLFINFELITHTTCFFQFQTSLDFVISNNRIKYFDKQEYKNCKLCNFTSNNENSNSTKRDVVFSFASGKVLNLVLFQRTLRTTGSNATIVIFLDYIAYQSIDKDTLAFSAECGTQIIVCREPEFVFQNQATKNYMFHIAYLFFKQNEGFIDRVVFLDLFDGLFQNDPFNDFIKHKVIHFARENMLNHFNPTSLDWIHAYDPYFTYSPSAMFVNTINSGYYGAYYEDLIVFLRVFLEHTKFNNAIDQGLINLMYLTNMLRKYDVYISPDYYEERVVHFSYYNPSSPFLSVRSKNVMTSATVLHLYYNGNDNFRKSILKVCPRISKNMTNYLDHNCHDINDVEEGLDEWTPEGKQFSD